MKKVLFTATVDSHILAFHTPYLKYFKDKGYEVHVATNGNEKIPYCDKKIKISFERSPFKINNIKAIKQLKKVINKEKYDIIHTHTPMGSVVTRLAAQKARKKYKTRVIYTAHGFHFYKGAPKKNWLIFYPVEKLLARLTDDLITINKEDYILAKNKFKTKVHYIPGVGINPKKFDIKMTDNEKKELRKSLGLKDDDYVMIYPARLDKNKNQILLIEVMRILITKKPNIHLLLPGKDELNGYHKKIIEKYNIKKNVHILGYRNDIPKLLLISNLSVSSSIREGLGLNLVEANYLGLPIIATKNRGHIDIVKENKNGYLIEIGDIQNFSDKIITLYENKKTYDNMKKNSIKMSKKFLLNNIKPKYEEIYEKNN